MAAAADRETGWAAKLRGVNWKIAGAVLILGAATEAAYLGDKLAERYNEKHYKPKLIDFPESGAEDGEAIDWSRCPEAFQPDENGRFPEEKGQFKLVKKSGEKAVRRCRPKGSRVENSGTTGRGRKKRPETPVCGIGQSEGNGGGGKSFPFAERGFGQRRFGRCV